VSLGHGVFSLGLSGTLPVPVTLSAVLQNPSEMGQGGNLAGMEQGENLAKTLPGSQVSANNCGHLYNNGPETAGQCFRMKKFWELQEIPSI
jgi:hypothetical protein